MNLYIIINIIIYLSFAVIYTNFANKLLKAKFNTEVHRILLLVGTALIFSISSLLSVFIERNILNLFFLLVVMILFTLSSFNSKIFYMIILPLGYLIIFIIINKLFIIIMSIISNINITSILKYSEFHVLISLLLTIITIHNISILIISININKKLLVKIRYGYVINVLIMTASSIINILIVKIADTYFEQQICIILIIFIWLINFLIISLASQTMVNNTLETLNRQYYYEQQYYKLIEVSDMEMHMIRHDLRNTILGAKSLLDEKKYNELDAYWNKIQIKFDKVDSIVRTDNKVLNSILNYKVKIARELHITVDCKVSYGMSIIDPDDLCILIGNIFDNAIEACQKVDFDEKIILCEILQIKNFYNIIIKNSYNPYFKINAKHLLTSKANKIYHGFGMNSIKRIVNKYNGIINIETIDNWFSVNISLPIICE